MVLVVGPRHHWSGVAQNPERPPRLVAVLNPGGVQQDDLEGTFAIGRQLPAGRATIGIDCE